MSAKVFVIGAGAWGTALAQAAIAAGNDVVVVARDGAAVESINTTHSLPKYLDDIVLSPALKAQTDYVDIEGADIVLLAVPAQASRPVLQDIGADVLAGKPVVLCAKGLERSTNLRQSQILAEIAPLAKPFVLSGPSFAHDVAGGKPTAVTLAGATIEAADAIASTLAALTFRLYSSDDLAGVELCGALKNVYALGAGAIEGAQLGLSARSAYLGRAFAEMGRVLEKVGGNEATLGSLAGIGDLALSCTANASRNYAFGIALGAGASVEEILARGQGLAEGVYTAPVARDLAQSLSVDVPLIDAVNRLLEGKSSIDELVIMLMTRPLKREG